MLTLVPDPSSVTDAGSIDTFPRQAAFVTGLRRRGVREEDEAKQNVDHQVSADASTVRAAGHFDSTE